jgi:hypothetical protein
MFDPRGYSPAQLKAIREIGDRHVCSSWYTTIYGNRSMHSIYYMGASQKNPSFNRAMIKRLMRQGVLTMDKGNSAMYYRLTPEALAWAKEQEND